MKIEIGWIALICITLMIITILIITHDWNVNINFTMDNNTLEAVKTINYTAILQTQKTLSCCYPSDCPQAINNPENCICEYAIYCSRNKP